MSRNSYDVSPPQWSFTGPGTLDEPPGWAVYLPYFYEGGGVWLNGTLVADVPEGSTRLRIRWERPFLVWLPTNLLLAGENDLAIRAAAPPAGITRRMPRVSVAPRSELQAAHDRRLFWARTMPQITVVVCLLMASFVLFIWWRRRTEVLYGLFGLAAMLWGIRALTFVIEQMPLEHWYIWRTVYPGATGGFIMVMAIFTLRLSGIHHPWTERGLLLYWFAGPAWLLIEGPNGEALVNRVWTAGLIPVGLAILAVAIWTMVRQRSLAAAVMPAALVIAVLAGVHDYLVAWDPGAFSRLLPNWTGHRIFLLHHGANILLVCMGGLLTARFIHAVSALEDLNLNLETRVAERERELATNFDRMAVLQKQQAASQERQSIMREIHDGLGSRGGRRWAGRRYPRQSGRKMSAQYTGEGASIGLGAAGTLLRSRTRVSLQMPVNTDER